MRGVRGGVRGEGGSVRGGVRGDGGSVRGGGGSSSRVFQWDRLLQFLHK